MTSLIAWLSICLLAAAWGPLLSMEAREAWSHFGLFGLAAALGLEVIARARDARRRQVGNQQLADEQNRRLRKIEGQNRSERAIREATRRIAEDCGLQGCLVDTPSANKSLDLEMERRSETRTSCWKSVEVLLYPIGDSAEAWVIGLQAATENDQPSLPAYLRAISPTGVGLRHRQFIDTFEGVVRTELTDGSHVALLATLCWCRPDGDGWYLSGWKLVAVLAEMERRTSLDAACAS